jgi:hypothetical protein
MPPATPQLVPQPPVVQPEPVAAATSLSTRLLTTFVSPAPPLYGTPAAPKEQWSTHLEQPEHPRSMSQSPSGTQVPQKSAVSPSPPYLITANMPETPLATILHPQPLVEPLMNPVPPRLTLVPTRLNWAEDAASMHHVPTAAGSLDPEDRLYTAIWNLTTTNKVTTSPPTNSFISKILSSTLAFARATSTFCHPMVPPWLRTWEARHHHPLWSSTHIGTLHYEA